MSETTPSLPSASASSDRPPSVSRRRELALTFLANIPMSSPIRATPTSATQAPPELPIPLDGIAVTPTINATAMTVVDPVAEELATAPPLLLHDSAAAAPEERDVPVSAVPSTASALDRKRQLAMDFLSGVSLESPLALHRQLSLHQQKQQPQQSEQQVQPSPQTMVTPLSATSSAVAAFRDASPGSSPVLSALVEKQATRRSMHPLANDITAASLEASPLQPFSGQSSAEPETAVGATEIPPPVTLLGEAKSLENISLARRRSTFQASSLSIAASLPKNANASGAVGKSTEEGVNLKDALLPTFQKGMLSFRTRKRTEEAMDVKSRVFLVGSMGIPFVTFSVLRFHDEKARKKKAAVPYLDSVTNLDVLKLRKMGESFSHLLEPIVHGVYVPSDLDDPELKTGKHRTVITLPCYIGSIIQYTRPSDLRRELNDQFRQKHQDRIHPSMTLSKVRNLKSKMMEAGEMADLELLTVACAYVYLEKLIFKKLVSKENRKQVAAVCLFLAAKMFDKKDVKYTLLLETLEKKLSVSPREVRDYEFFVFSQLDFDLLIPPEEYMPHLERILNSLDFVSFQEYLMYYASSALRPAGIPQSAT